MLIKTLTFRSLVLVKGCKGKETPGQTNLVERMCCNIQRNINIISKPQNKEKTMVKLTRKLKNQESGLKSLLNMLTSWKDFTLC